MTYEEKLVIERTPPPSWVINATGARSVRPRPVVDFFEEDAKTCHRMFQSLKHALARHGSVSLKHEVRGSRRTQDKGRQFIRTTIS